MTASPTFGKRIRPAEAAVDPLALPDAAEAFRRELAGKREVDAAFAAWRKDAGARRAHVWFLRAAFFSPGLIAAAYGAPLAATLALEVLGFAASVWFRAERSRHLREIAAWEAEDEASEGGA